MTRPLIDLARVFALLSLLSFGGGNSVLAEMQRQVTALGWVSPREFLDFYAIGRAAPGPGMQMVALIGWHVAGWAGALVAATAMFLPSSLLIFAVTAVWGRLPDSPGKQAVQQGLAPIAVGLTLAGAVALLRTSDDPPRTIATALICGAILLKTRVNPLFLLVPSAALFLVIG